MRHVADGVMSRVATLGAQRHRVTGPAGAGGLSRQSNPTPAPHAIFIDFEF